MRTLARGFAFLLAAASSAAAQSVNAGVSAGWVKLTDSRSEEALSGTLEYQAGWLSLYAMPGVLHVSSTVSGRTVSSSGLGDTPLVAAASYTAPGPGSPTVAAALLAVLPTGNASCGLGMGQTTAGVDVGAGLSPGKAHLSADASHSVSGISSQSVLNAPKATTLRFEAGYDVAPRWTWTASVGVDVGTSDSTQALSRVIGLGVSHTLRGALLLNVDGSRGLTTASPQWVLSVGLGTAFGGSSPVTPTTPLRRLRTTFSGVTSRTSCP
ncbi:MAG TPA: transporter [Gemmatimonadales bacterium]|nr:transporter [Gemmatimonadales bacterium]